MIFVNHSNPQNQPTSAIDNLIHYDLAWEMCSCLLQKM